MDTKQTVADHLSNSAASSQWKKITIGDHHGIVIPLFSLHSKNSCGIGEYLDLLPMVDWCHEVGFDIIQLLPLNDTGLETSPYSALSAFALNPIHLSLNALPNIESDLDLKNQIEDLQKTTTQQQRVDYKNIQPKREKILRGYYRQYGSLIKNQEAYQAFKKEQQYWLNDYALFKALKILHHWKTWEEWTSEFKTPSREFLQYPPSEIATEAEYHSFLQFLCFQQFERVKQEAEKVSVLIKGDVPILINRESADVWRHPELFSLEFAAGAPPDMYSEDGQKWGFPLYKWDALASENYHWWIQRLKVAEQFYHIYRIDHIVGFFRIWAIPLLLSAKEGFFLPREEEQWIPQGETVMQIMLVNCQMLPIGEDLGSVPSEVRKCLKDLGICGTKVMRWERYWNGDQSFINPKDYPAESMTTVSTHDSETLKLWWKNNPHEAMIYAHSVGWDYTTELSPSHQFAILLASHQSGSLFHLNLLQEYLALLPGMTWPDPEDERINLPGIISDKNWSYRFLPSVEEIVNNVELKEIFQKFIELSK